MLKHLYFSTTLFFVLIHIFLLANTMPRKRSIQRQRRSSINKRRRLNTAPVEALVQGINSVEEVHPVETDTNNNPHPDLVPSLCEFIDRKKLYKQH